MGSLGLVNPDRRVRIGQIPRREVLVPGRAADNPTARGLPSKDPAQRRRFILEAAVAVLEEKGFAGTRVSDVAAAAGTSPALVVYHFKSLDGVLAEALASVEDEFYQGLAQVIPPDADAVETLRILADQGAETGPGVGDWSLWMDVWVRSLRDPQTAALRRSLDARWRATLAEVIGAGVDQGLLQTSDVAMSAVHLAALMDGLAVQHALSDLDATAMRGVWLRAAGELATSADVRRRLTADR